MGRGKNQKTGKIKKTGFLPPRALYISHHPRPAPGLRPSVRRRRCPGSSSFAPPFLRLRPHSLRPSPRFALCLGALTPAYPRGVPSCACVRDLDHAFPTVALRMRIYAYARLRAMGVAGFLSLLQFLSFPLYIIILGVWGPEARPPALRLVGPRMVVAAPRPAPIHGGAFLSWLARCAAAAAARLVGWVTLQSGRLRACGHTRTHVWACVKEKPLWGAWAIGLIWVPRRGR